MLVSLPAMYQSCLNDILDTTSTDRHIHSYFCVMLIRLADLFQSTYSQITFYKHCGSWPATVGQNDTMAMGWLPHSALPSGKICFRHF